MGVITSDVLQVIDNEVDSVLRALAKYSNEDQLFAERPSPAPAPAKPARKATPTPAAPTLRSAPASPSESPDQSNRRARILTIIEAKGEVSIKDITDIISDVSEKTIQRELNAMIEDNQIKRIGERRWSKYVLF
jgi:predicted HTH transcriptional regulator